MSAAERYGTEVWRGLIHSDEKDKIVDTSFKTVGEVSRRAGVSRATARKYLEKLVADGHAQSVTAGRFTVYAVAEKYK